MIQPSAHKSELFPAALSTSNSGDTYCAVPTKLLRLLLRRPCGLVFDGGEGDEGGVLGGVEGGEEVDEGAEFFDSSSKKEKK